MAITEKSSSCKTTVGTGHPATWAALVVALWMVGLGGCVEGYEAPLPDRQGLYYPIGVHMHPDGRFLYVINSNFDLRYRDDQGGSLAVIDTETDQILHRSSPYLPSFGSYLAFNEEATKAYVPTRQNNELTILSVASEGQAMYCEVDGEPSANTRPCTVRRIPDTREGTRLSSDPFGIAVGRAQRTVGGVESDFDVVHLSYLRGTDVTTMSFPDENTAGASIQTAALMGQGGNQIRMRPGTNDVFVAGRGANRVEGFRPYLNAHGEVEAILRSHSIPILHSGAAIDARGLDFDDNGDWLYVATRRPAALHVVGMRGAAGPRVVSTIALDRNPSDVHVHRGADGKSRIYVPSYRYGIIEVVDPRKEAVVDTIEVGRSPYDMTTDSRPAHCREPGQRCRGYVTLFDAGEDRRQRCEEDASHCGMVAIIDLDPASETFHTVIDTIQ